MDGNKEFRKEGLSVKELENFSKKHRLELFLCIFYFLAGVFGIFLWRPTWCIILATVGAIIGALMPEKIRQMSMSVWQFVARQDKTTTIIIAVIAFVIAIFVPPLVFLLVGLHAGKSMHNSASQHFPGER